MITCIFLAGQFWLQQDNPKILVRVDSIVDINSERIELSIDRRIYFTDYSTEYYKVLDALQSCETPNE